MVTETAIRYCAGLGWSLVECPPSSRFSPDHKWLLIRPADWWADEGIPFKNIRALWWWWREQAEDSVVTGLLCQRIADFFYSGSENIQKTILNGLDKDSLCWIGWSDDFERLRREVRGITPRLGRGWLRQVVELHSAKPEPFYPSCLKSAIRRELVAHQASFLETSLPSALASTRSVLRI
jgi:hypothetical protein